MKKILAIVFALGITGGTINAQEVNSSKVPAAVKTAFGKAHGSTKVSWTKEKEGFEAEFKADGKSVSELYAASGTLLESEVEIKFDELPAAVKAKLKGMKVKEAAKITKASGQVVYEAEVGGKDLMFDEKGNAAK